MNPPCARCKKTVYPIELLRCLDKAWHKACFTCEVCNLKLTMKNYKGYNKLPYCNTHYPTTKFTSVSDTPENLRLKKQSQTQSQVEYQKEHRKNLQKFTTVSDDPESLRLKKASYQASQVTYKQQGGLPPQTRRAGPDYPAQSDPPYHPPPQHQQPRDPSYQPPPQPTMPAQPPVPVPPPQSSGLQYVAIYDYTAADDDEVSFNEGDIITNAEVIDPGWMTGTVQRTGEHGMLPSNYVE